MDSPRARYATASGGGRVAYQVVGDGGTDVLLVTNWGECVDLMLDEPRIERFLHRLASNARLILFDKRSTGASDPREMGHGGLWLSLLENAAEDILAVLDAAGSAT